MLFVFPSLILQQRATLYGKHHKRLKKLSLCICVNSRQMGNTGLKQHLENAQKTGAFQLTNKGITEFPTDLLKLTNLRTLDLSGNKLIDIPGSISSLTALKHLSIQNNKLGAIPENIGKLTKLETLNLSGNLLSSLPNSLSQLKHLKQINLSDNMLNTIPACFYNLKHLDVLDLSKNKITEIPSGIQALEVLELNINQNQISVISEDIARCPRLKTLRMEENCLALNTIPIKLLSDSSVSVLALEGNLFDMKELVHLDGHAAYVERFTATKRKLD